MIGISRMEVDESYSRLLYCRHCDRLLLKSTFYRHRNKYFDTVAGKWTKLQDENTCLVQLSEDDSSEGMDFTSEQGESEEMADLLPDNSVDGRYLSTCVLYTCMYIVSRSQTAFFLTKKSVRLRETNMYISHVC